jgi:hydrogenase maturation factor
MGMSTDPKVIAKQLQKVVITRACMTRTKENEPLKNFKVGDEVVITRQFADELVSINKAVVHGTPEHEFWLSQQKQEAKKTDEKKKNKDQ